MSGPQINSYGLAARRCNIGRETTPVKSTVLVLILPWLVNIAFPILSNSAEEMMLVLVVAWWFTIGLCFLQGFIILRQHRVLAWCCFTVGALQFYFAMVAFNASLSLNSIQAVDARF